jgi:ribosomal protein S18 acetylase RimI-like enzyme
MNTYYYEKLKDPERLAIIDLCDYYGQGLIITRIKTPREHRRKGIANRLLAKCLADADAEQVTLWLEVVSSGEMTSTQLAEWYTRKGFKELGVSGLFRRAPQ